MQVNEARQSYAIEKKKPFVYDRCYEILKEHKMFDLNITSSNMQRSQCGPSDSNGSSINIGDNSSPIEIEGPEGNMPTERNEAKLEKKRKGKEKNLSVQNAALERTQNLFELYEQKMAKIDANLKEIHDQMERLVFFREEEQERNNREEARRNREEERRIREDQRLEREEQRRDVTDEITLMGMDLSCMSDQQRELYNYRIQELLNRRRQNHQASQNFSGNF